MRFLRPPLRVPVDWLAAVSSLAPSLALRWWTEPARCTCIVEAPRVQPELLELLARQLDRCGPANLTQPACGPLPPPPPDHALLLFAAGVVVGVSVAAGLFLLWSLRVDPLPADAPSPAPASALSLSSTPAALGRRRAPPGSLSLRDTVA